MNPLFILFAVFGTVCAEGGSHGHAGANGRSQRPAINHAAAPAPGQYGAPSGPLSQYGAAAPIGDNYGAASSLNGVQDGGDGIEDLQNNIPGVPGEDYPVLAEVPELGFACDGRVAGGYYADPEAKCQVFHICTEDEKGGFSKVSFLCPNGTIFNQNYFICDWWFNFDCSEAEGLYSLNDDIAKEREELAAAASTNNLSTYVAAGAGAQSSPEGTLATYVENRVGRSRKVVHQPIPVFSSGF